MFDLGPQYKVDLSKSKTPSGLIYKGRKYRISIISDTLIRFEYSETGSFNDYPTFFATNRSFGKPNVTTEEDNEILMIRNDRFVIEYHKEKPYVGTKISPDANLKVMINDTDKVWYFNHPEVKNFGGTSYSLDDMKTSVNLDKGLFSIDGFASFDDSRTPILNEYGNIVAPNYNNVDTYLFVYSSDFGTGLRDYFNLTGLPPLIPRYALGVWWSKDESYTEEELLYLVNRFKKNEIPLSAILLGDYARQKFEGTDVSFTMNKGIFPNPKAMSDFLHKNNIYLGTSVITEGKLSNMEDNYNSLMEDNKGDEINVYDSAFMDAFLKKIINPYMNQGIDFLLVNNKIKEHSLRDYSMNYFLSKNFENNLEKRGMILSRNFGITPHKYSLLYSGETNIKWKTLEFLPFFNANASNIGVSWWSHDIGGYKGGIEDSELYMRYVQFGTYSPILRLSSSKGKYYKREPWKWDAKTFKIVHDYLRLRHRLIPYLYSEAKKYSSFGSPLIQPLYYRYPDTYDEPRYKKEYYFGTELFIAPIVTPKDTIMNRVVHRIFLPNGIWYDFKTGKKFPGGNRYVTFYKDEDYPVFARTGAIIPMAVLDEDNLNDTSSPKTMEIHIFPGRSNTYKLYEDDGHTYMYKEGKSLTTEINYYYKANDFSVSLEPKEGTTDVVPKKRNYIIRFRNTKYTEGVQVFCNEYNIQFRSYADDTDFVIEFDDVPTDGRVFVYCKGKDIEIDASRVINDDLESIITDLPIKTELKEKLDKIIFSDTPIKDKRIAIRKLRRDGLSTIFIRMFIKLFDYIQGV